MKTYITTALLASVIGLTACGGKKEETSIGAVAPAVEAPAKPKSSGGGLVLTKEQKLADTYISEMDKIADALERVNDEASAQAAAKAIAEASNMMEAAKQAYGEEMSGPAAMAVFMPRQQEFIAVQSRISMGMAGIAQSNPQFLQMISAEMENLPSSN